MVSRGCSSNSISRGSRQWTVDSGQWTSNAPRKEIRMGRLRQETLERADRYADRTLDVVEVLERQRRYRRVVDQMAGSGTSAGANLYEADQALSAKDFTKTLGVVLKELNETKFWLRLVGRRGWIKPARLADLLD